MSAPRLTGGWPFSVYAAGGSKPGQILRVGSCSDRLARKLQAGPGEEWFPGLLDPASQMIDVTTGEAVDRPTLGLPAALQLTVGQEVALDVPVGTKLRLRGQPWEVVDAPLPRLGFILPGMRIVAVRPPWPLREFELQVTIDDVVP